eukprot:CAMPEP_0179233662 /NCGR_PEP_ID=MMETSP0797-20121207/12490_1 /TAXON_ID=47934 /ORGANISM="Dinophysis acuminata, Strain DAEP01" /LENGTH=489 /DNA_ID=CAMNT_0020940819 /DNA_START=65 /DNA_END=1532 /DNA_ORIENTATION=-
MPRRAAALLLLGAAARGLDLDVHIHYPEVSSAVDLCGFSFGVVTSLSADQSEEAAVPAERSGDNLFAARVRLPDCSLNKEALIGVMAAFDEDRRLTPACNAVCPDFAPQGKVVQLGVYRRTAALRGPTAVDLWPSFCRVAGATHTAAFRSAALGRAGRVHFRLPAPLLENPLPRPTAAMPPIVYRLNSEWYWPHGANESDHDRFWQDLMLRGNMETVVLAELRIDGVTHGSWSVQPADLHDRAAAGQVRGVRPGAAVHMRYMGGVDYGGFTGGDHNYGSAADFFQELYDKTIPPVLAQLPPRTDTGTLRVGVWGYCIGGLGAWNALVTHPELYNIGYVGSAALDFNCGDAFRDVPALRPREGMPRPKVYIDSGSAEGELMNSQTLLLFEKLQGLGLVQGRDVFYSQALFGTHQAGSVLRRATAGLLALFGAGQGQGRLPEAVGEAAPCGATPSPPPWERSPPAVALALAAGLAGVFLAGRASARAGPGR